MRIIIADDHAMIRDGLRPFLMALGDDVEVVDAATLDEAMAAADAGPVDLLLLDIEMPGMQGVGTVADVRRRLPTTPVVVLSGRVERATVLKALESGASGFLPKTLHADSLQHALRLILSDGSYFPMEVLAQGDAGQAAGMEVPAGLASLTPREREIAHRLAKGAPNKEIARDLGLTDITVKSHLRNVYRKIGVQNRTQAAAIILRELGEP